MTHEIEFHSRFILPLLEGRKTQSTRIHDRFGGVGDFLTVDGDDYYALRLQITGKRKSSLKSMSYLDASKEGFATPQMFLKFWDTLYAGTAWESKNDPTVWVIEFQIISKWHDREWLKKMYSEKGLF